MGIRLMNFKTFFSTFLLFICSLSSAYSNSNNSLLNSTEKKFNTIASSTPPSSKKFSSELQNKINALQQSRGTTYRPRTKHLTVEGNAKFTNRLFLETSPYLLQHAHNPVNWYPWGDEAFNAAKKLNRPILLSVGYSTCHWCHVMEEESFEDMEIATFINENYIAIKVDREERPDIDAIYMAALHAMGQGGGWPMNVWLTPDRKPFYGGTYFPARDGDRGASIGFLSLLSKLKFIYESQPNEIIAATKNLTAAIKKSLLPVVGTKLPKQKNTDRAVRYYKEKFDDFYGGIGNAPKFPNTTPFQFLLRYYKRSGDTKILKIINLTLNKMAAGGIYDHIGGGFHRYSTDNEWLVPHFEKMLYDNALLSVDYLEAYQLTKNTFFKRINNDILNYIKNEMTSPAGGFYSATDAVSLTSTGKTEEGYYFTWSEDELIEILGDQNYQIFKAYYATSKQGNFEGRNILNTPKSIEAVAEALKLNITHIKKSIGQSKNKLYQHRKKRIPPLRDEKIITAWNAIMISAYAKSGLVLNNNEFKEQAVKSAQFIIDHLYKNGTLYRSYKDGLHKYDAYLSDYAFFIAALLDVYEVTFDIKWLRQAIELDKILEAQFEDKKEGGYFMTSHHHEQLISREKPSFDSAEPTGNSVQVLNLLRLAEFTSNTQYLKRAENTLISFSNILNKAPMALSKMLVALDFYYDEAKEIIIITPKGKKSQSQVFLNSLQKNYLPNRVISVMSEGNDLQLQSKIIAIAEGKIAINGKTTAYVCRQGSCELPTNNVDIFTQQIQKFNVKKVSK